MLGLLYAHALRVPEQRLSALERLRTRHKIESYVVMGATGLVSALYAAVMPGWMGVWAGFIYATLPITMPIQAGRQLRQVERFDAEGRSGG